MQTEEHFVLYGGKVSGVFKENKETGYHAYFVTDEENGIVNKRPAGVTTIIGIKDKSAPLVIWSTELARDYLLEKYYNGEMSEEIIKYSATIHREKLKTAGDIGSEIHDWCEKYIRNKLGQITEEPKIPTKREVKIGAISFLNWVKEHNVKFISTEKIVYSRKYGYVGKMDIEAIVDDEYSLVDLKSSNGLYNSVKMQTASYAKADEEEDKPKYKRRWAIRLSKETEKEYIARMEKKGKTNYPPYQVFEAMKFEENEEDNIEKDFEAFLACKTVYDWNNKTDFYKLNK